MFRVHRRSTRTDRNWCAFLSTARSQEKHRKMEQYLLIFQTSKRYDFDSVRACVSHAAIWATSLSKYPQRWMGKGTDRLSFDFH